MGRKKIDIKMITSEKNRQVTFNKRRVGLMKKAMELSILCGCEVGLIVLFDRKLHVYSSSNIESIIKSFHDYEGPYESLDNKDRESLQPGRASSFKVHHQKLKARRSPCQHCGCCEASCGQSSLTSGQVPSSTMQNPHVYSGDYNAQVNPSQYAHSRPGTKRQRFGSMDNEPQGSGMQNGLQSDVKMYGNQFHPPAPLQRMPSRRPHPSQSVPPHLSGTMSYGGSDSANSSQAGNQIQRRTSSGGSLLQKRSSFKPCGPVVIPNKTTNVNIVQQFNPGSGTPFTGPSSMPQSAGSIAGSMFPPFTPGTGGEVRGGGGGMMRTAVLPSPSGFFAETPTGDRSGGSASGLMSINIGTDAVPSLSPFGWNTPTNTNNGQSFSKIPGHPDSKAAEAATSASTDVSADGGADKSQAQGGPADGGFRARREKGGKPLSMRRALKLNNLDLSTLRKPNPRVVEVANSSENGGPASGPSPVTANSNAPQPMRSLNAASKPPRHEAAKAQTPTAQTPGLGPILTPSLGIMAFSPDRNTGDMQFFNSPHGSTSAAGSGLDDESALSGERIAVEGLNAISAMARDVS
mmetsp:Transcript_27179/g.52708  ORF Transcript_27179/g.52708 Transcript_27179/m.52708 type:complete len:576 (+) Transcript_27179:59-1786(+)